MAHGPWKKLLDFGGNSDRVMLELGLWLGWLGLVGDGRVISHVSKSGLLTICLIVTALQDYTLHGCVFDFG